MAALLPDAAFHLDGELARRPREVDAPRSLMAVGVLPLPVAGAIVTGREFREGAVPVLSLAVLAAPVRVMLADHADRTAGESELLRKLLLKRRLRHSASP